MRANRKKKAKSKSKTRKTEEHGPIPSVQRGLLALVDGHEESLAVELDMPLDPKWTPAQRQSKVATAILYIMKSNGLDLKRVIAMLFDKQAMATYAEVRLGIDSSGTLEQIVDRVVEKWSDPSFELLDGSQSKKEAGESDVFHYFGYGSNLLKQRIRLSNKSAEFVSAGLLKDHRLGFVAHSSRWNGGVATIYPAGGTDVWGAVWTLKKEDQQSLDDQEGVSIGIYEPLSVKVILGGTTSIVCRTYRYVNKQEPPTPPSILYKRVIVTGALECKLPPEYITKLKMIKHNGKVSDFMSLDDLDDYVSEEES